MITKRQQSLLDRVAAANRAVKEQTPPEALDALIRDAPMPPHIEAEKHQTMTLTTALEAERAKNAALVSRVEGGQVIDAGLVDVRGFNRLVGAFDESNHDFAALCQAIRETQGNVVPALVRPSPTSPGRYELVFGERRLRACRSTGQPFTAAVREVADDMVQVLREAENVARKDRSLVERAFSMAEIADRCAFGTREAVMAGFGVSPASMSRFRAIAQVPIECWQVIPGVDALRVLEAESLAKSYQLDPAAFRERLTRLTPSMTRTAAVRLVAGLNSSPRPLRVTVRMGKASVCFNGTLPASLDQPTLERELRALLERLSGAQDSAD
jgi:ParB/RepB/Spo0J family partition protein